MPASLQQAHTHYNTYVVLQLSVRVPTSCRDYRPNEVLDAYEAEGIDETSNVDMTMEEQLEARRRAERELNKRDRRENRGGFPGALNGKSCTALLSSPATYAQVIFSLHIVYVQSPIATIVTIDLLGAAE